MHAWLHVRMYVCMKGLRVHVECTVHDWTTCMWEEACVHACMHEWLHIGCEGGLRLLPAGLRPQRVVCHAKAHQPHGYAEIPTSVRPHAPAPAPPRTRGRPSTWTRRRLPCCTSCTRTSCQAAGARGRWPAAGATTRSGGMQDGWWGGRWGLSCSSSPWVGVGVGRRRERFQGVTAPAAPAAATACPSRILDRSTPAPIAAP